MKDKTSIFKHSGVGTGFYGRPHRACDHFQETDQYLTGKYFQADQQ